MARGSGSWHAPPVVAARAGCGWIAVGVLAFVVLLPLGAARADAPSAVWVGLARGPLPPARAARLERDVVAALDRVEWLVDAGGRPLGPRGVERVEREVRALRDRGVDAFLRLAYPKAFARLERARVRFEDRLGGLGEKSLYEEIGRASCRERVSFTV